MAKNTKKATQPTPTWKDYEFGEAAKYLLRSEEGSRYVTGALDNQAKAVVSGDAEGFVLGAYASEKGIATATKVYSGKFADKQKSLTISELAETYGDVFKGLNPKEKAVYDAIIAEHGSSTIGNITKKVKEAAEIKEKAKKFPNCDVTAEEIVKANATFNKYQTILVVLENMKNYGLIERLRPQAVESTRAREFGGLVRKIVGIDEE